MPVIDWTPEHKRVTSLEFDRLKLKVGERARIVSLEKPTFTWTHTMRAPKLTEGRANKVIKKRKDGTEYADWEMDFIGRPQCLGDHATIDVDGVDPVNCPACARAKESEEIFPPERRFAMNIIKYNTKADSTLVSPFGCSSQVWTFTEGIYNKLYDIAQEYGGLVGRDLILGPCQVPEMYQKFDITAGAKNVWETDEAIKKIVVETHTNNRLETNELELACGRKPEPRWFKADIDKIAKAWRVAHGTDTPESGGSEKADVSDLKGELDNLLAPPPAPAPPTTDTVNVSGQIDEKPQGVGPTDDPNDFSKLLEGLKL